MTDPLFDLLSLLEIEDVRYSRLEAGGRWGLRFPGRSMLKFVVVLKGRCWLVEAGEAAHPVAAGDIFLLVNTPSYAVVSDMEATIEDGMVLRPDAGELVIRVGGGDETTLLGGILEVDREGLGLVSQIVPSFVKIASGELLGKMLHATLDLLKAELESGGAGSALLTRHLVNILLLQAFRAFSAEAKRTDPGEPASFVDLPIQAALSSMHREPGRTWTVAGLAASVGLSRSAFAARFKTFVGMPPLDYLRRWRLQRACHALRAGKVSVGKLAAELGYSSESSFANAFKRAFGQPPKRWSSDAHGARRPG